ncbi:putative Sensor histidine kinase [Nitrospira japonica]|uniref:histidine kinase n=1 Tax=Nitrospira japonica TaxID=1325564 RepID=A0A1W1IAV9_9BACT|nr:ATP-binding protein [Nitrospira japonica]SLM50051.1 putative Sensor histidine kinase [Nitrospira japonica]
MVSDTLDRAAPAQLTRLLGAPYDDRNDHLERHILMWRRISGLFNDLPIARKLLLTSLIPLVAFLVLGLDAYERLEALTEHEEQLDRVYVAQRAAAEYMRMIVDYETGFRGYVMTRQEAYLVPSRNAHQHLPSVEQTLLGLIRPHKLQYEAVEQAQRLVKQMMEEKESLIQLVKGGRTAEALHYIEQSRGRALMQLIREHMARFDRLEQEALNDALANMAKSRNQMVAHIMGGIAAVLVLLILALQLIARSITGPLISLAKSVRSSDAILPADVPVLPRQDELGELTRVMNTMSRQVREHLASVQKNQAELRDLNQNLAASEDKYRNIVDHAPFGIFTTSGMTVTFSNRYNKSLAGMNPDEAGEPEAFRHWIHPDDRDRVLREYEQAVADGMPYETVFRFVRPDGTIRKVLSRRIPIKNEDGQPTMYQGFNVDVTALDEMQTQLSRAERLATLGQVAAGIAHEIRNPLVGIGSTASLLRDEIDPSDPKRADLDIILNETRRLDRIVNQIIDYARPRDLVPASWLFKDAVEDVLKLLDGRINTQHIAVTYPSNRATTVYADRDQIKQVLLNLCHNALDAMPDGGSLRLDATEVPRDDKPGALIEIADSGPGIPEHALTQVFQPFFTTGKQHGTGLGLAICRNIVEAHGGDIALISQRGNGTTARLWLPLKTSTTIMREIL